MHHHRFRDREEFVPVPAVRPPVSASAFVVCPLALAQGGGSEQIYRLAYEQAQAVLRPSRLERLHAVSWN